MLRRQGLNARTAAQSDAAQVSLEMGNGGYDLDQEIEGLAGSVQRLKQVQLPHQPCMDTTCCRQLRACACMQMGKAISEETNMQKQITDSLVRSCVSALLGYLVRELNQF